MSAAQARPQPTGVSAKAEAALREAMQRLLTGRPQHTDGRLTKQNLWKEAGVSRATMNRATAVLADWDSRLSEHDMTAPHETRRDKEITDLKRRLADKTTECTRLGQQLKAAATAIAALHHDNESLRAELDQYPQSSVVNISAWRRRSSQTAAGRNYEAPGWQNPT